MSWVFLVILILLLAVAFLIYVCLPPWFRNHKFSAFKPSEHRKQPSEEAYLVALESGEIVAPKVTVTAISLATRTKGVVKLYQITNNGLKELKQKNYCFESKGMYSAWWEAISLSDSPFKGSEKYRFVGVLTNGKRMQFCLHERYLDSGKSYMISSSEGLGADRIDLKLTNLTPNARYLIDGEYRNADDDGCITVNFHCINNYKWLSSGRLHVSRVDNYGFTDIVDIKLSLWNP